jgi:hypothetical protein
MTDENQCRLTFNRVNALASVENMSDTLNCTSGQTCGAPTLAYYDEIVDINLDCDRKGSSGNAGVFNGWCNNEWTHATAVTHSAYLPEALNFCFKILFGYHDGSSQEIFIGQGHNLGGNNWWLGSLGIGRVGDNVPVLHATDGTDWYITASKNVFAFETS